MLLSLLLPLASAEISKRHNSRNPNQHKSHSTYKHSSIQDSYNLQYTQNGVFDSIPQEIRPTEDTLLAKTFAVGTQNYKCIASRWELESVDANLSKDRHTLENVQVSYYFLPTKDPDGGQPTWMYLNDYSTFTGKPVAKSVVDPNSIPWVLISRTSGSTSGVMSKVSSVLRVHTQGGNPPTSGCQEGQSSRVGYTAK